MFSYLLVGVFLVAFSYYKKSVNDFDNIRKQLANLFYQLKETDVED